MDLIRYARGARSCYFEERFRCTVCRVVVRDLYERPCAVPAEECGLTKGWYGAPTPQQDSARASETFRSQVWRFVALMTFLIGLFALNWIGKRFGG